MLPKVICQNLSVERRITKSILSLGQGVTERLELRRQ